MPTNLFGASELMAVLTMANLLIKPVAGFVVPWRSGIIMAIPVLVALSLAGLFGFPWEKGERRARSRFEAVAVAVAAAVGICGW